MGFVIAPHLKFAINLDTLLVCYLYKYPTSKTLLSVTFVKSNPWVKVPKKINVMMLNFTESGPYYYYFFLPVTRNNNNNNKSKANCRNFDSIEINLY